MERSEDNSIQKMSDTEAYIQNLILTNSLREPVLRSAIQALQLQHGSRGLDAGCGIGLQALLLADTVGATGHVTGLDISSDMLSYGEQLAQQAGLSSQISLQEGSVSQTPFDDDTFDWAWSADCVGYIPVEPVLLMNELVRIVKPGGLIAIVTWSSEMLLPGYPILETRLRNTDAGIAPFIRHKKPEKHWLRALGWFHEVSLEDITVKTFVGDAYAPLSDDIRRALVELLHMRWQGAKSELTDEEWSEYQRLCHVESPDFILGQPDYYAFFTYSMFQGKVVK